MPATLAIAKLLVATLTTKGLWITTVESCTGGALSSAITDIPGASLITKGSFVTYSNEQKIKLGVPAGIIERHTVYSVETAEAMARAGLAASVKADIAVGITGSLSRVDPGNQANSIPGEVYIAVLYQGKVTTRKMFADAPTRPEAKEQILQVALQMVIDAIGK